MSRSELADAVNAALDDLYSKVKAAANYVDSRWVGKLERGEHRWPSVERRTALRHVLKVNSDAALGLYSPRRTAVVTADADSPRVTYPVESGGHTESGAADGARQTPVRATATACHEAAHPSDTVALSVRLDGREVIFSLSRRDLLQIGVGPLLDAFVLGRQSEVLREAAGKPRLPDHLTVTSPAHLNEILTHLREQWHAQVRTDNLLGPRFALASVHSHLTLIEALRSEVRDKQRLEAVRLGAQYAESAAWLYEDSGDLDQARYWTSRAMEWAYEANDQRMMSWTIFRRSQQAAATARAAEVIGLAQAARRDENQLPKPMRAAIRVQEAYGHALDGNENGAQRLLDEAHTWAASDDAGDARGGHGSYCTPGYIEIQRANCWLASGKATRAISLYEGGLRTLPAVYQRNRAAAQSRLAVAYAATAQLEQAASTAHVALPVARSTGSRRILEEIKALSVDLAPHRRLQGVAALLDDLGRVDE